MSKEIKHTIILKDSLDPKNAEIEVLRAYNGVLFVSHFCLSKKDAMRLAEYIKQIWPSNNEGK